MKRNFGLDLVRAFSIWLVLLQHGQFNIPGLAPMKIGSIGVEIFFVLSGFLIGGILYKEIDKQQGIWQTLKNFWTRRWFRILPLYYAVLLFKFVLIDNSIGWNILYYVFFLQNNFYGIDFLGVSWSLVIEEWFYLFAPLFLLFLHKVIKKDNWIVLSLFTFLLMVNLARFAYVKHGNVPWEGVNGNFPFRFDSLFVGVILAYFKRYKNPYFLKLSTLKFLVLGGLIFLSYIFYYWTQSQPINLINERLFPRTVGFFILPLSIGLMVPFFSAFHTFEKNSALAKGFFFFVTKTSLFTYAIYLIHPFIFAYVYHQHSLKELGFFTFLICIASTYFLAGLTYKYFERPILKYRDRITQN